VTATHTPGPWTWSDNCLHPVKQDPIKSAVHSILDAEGGYGFVGSKVADTLAELDADRLLIAAAPELLEALRKMVAIHDEPSGFAGKFGKALDEAIAQQQDKIDTRLSAARAAIAKATGDAL